MDQKKQVRRAAKVDLSQNLETSQKRNAICMKKKKKTLVLYREIRYYIEVVYIVKSQLPRQTKSEAT